jgi:hypothetical protein
MSFESESQLRTVLKSFGVRSVLDWSPKVRRLLIHPIGSLDMDLIDLYLYQAINRHGLDS